MVALNDEREDQRHFCQREALADADTRTIAKRHVGVARSLCNLRGREVVRVEFQWVLPESRMPVERIGAPEDHRFRWNTVTAHLIIMDRTTHELPGWRVETQGFIKHHTCIGQLRKIVCR